MNDGLKAALLIVSGPGVLAITCFLVGDNMGVKGRALATPARSISVMFMVALLWMGVLHAMGVWGG